jgi:hypothetical protein
MKNSFCGKKCQWGGKIRQPNFGGKKKHVWGVGERATMWYLPSSPSRPALAGCLFLDPINATLERKSVTTWSLTHAQLCNFLYNSFCFEVVILRLSFARWMISTNKDQLSFVVCAFLGLRV